MRGEQVSADPSRNTGRRGLEARRTAHERQLRLQMGLTGEVYADLMPGPTLRGYDLISLSTGNLKRSTDNFKGASRAENHGPTRTSLSAPRQLGFLDDLRMNWEEAVK